MGRVERLDRYQRTHGWLGFPLAVVYKLFDDRGPYLAAGVTYYAFLSLFPLTLLFLGITGYVLHGDPHLQSEVVSSALGNVPGIGTQIKQNIGGFKGSVPAIIVGVVGVLYGSVGATQSAQYAFNVIYAVPRNEQPNPVKSRIRSIGLLTILGTGVLVSSGINIIVTTGNDLNSGWGVGLKAAAYAGSLLINIGLFTAAFQLLTAARLRWRNVATGGATAAAGWITLQALGSNYVLHEFKHGSALYGTFGVVLATVAWLYLEALVLMVSAEINVVMYRRLWPRALMTPFTDDVDLTEADKAVYRSYAAAQRYKSFEVIETTFGEPGRDGRLNGRTGPAPADADLPVSRPGRR